MNSTVKIFIIIFICIFLIYHLIENKENWVPWVWNLPTRDIYPRLYYDIRCPPPIVHYYREVPRIYANHPYFRESSLKSLYSMYNPYNPNDIDDKYQKYTYLDYPDLVNPYQCPY